MKGLQQEIEKDTALQSGQQARRKVCCYFMPSLTC